MDWKKPDLPALLKRLEIPRDRAVDMVLDTDTYNEVDDQFALSYLLRSGDRLRTLGVCAAPFLNGKAASPGEGMEKSFEEIHRILPLVGTALPVYRGSSRFLPDEKTPVESEAARFIAETAAAYSPENPLYVVAIGAVTNVASALLLDERVRENTVLVWLGGNAHHFVHNAEFNLMQDVAAARVVFGCGVPLVQLPCAGVVDRFLITEAELTHCLQGKNPLCDFLVGQVKDEMAHAAGTPLEPYHLGRDGGGLAAERWGPVHEQLPGAQPYPGIRRPVRLRSPPPSDPVRAGDPPGRPGRGPVQKTDGITGNKRAAALKMSRRPLLYPLRFALGSFCPAESLQDVGLEAEGEGLPVPLPLEGQPDHPVQQIREFHPRRLP